QPKPKIGDDDGISNKAMNAVIVLFMLLTVGVSIATAVAGENVKYKILLRQAMLDMDRLDYDKAIPKLLEVRANSVENANVNHMLGMCYLYGVESPEKAVYFLNRAVKDASEEYEFWILEETRAPIETTYHLAKAYEAIDDFDNAAVYYAMFLDHLDTNTNMAFSKTYALIKSRAQDCRMAAEHQKPSAEIQENVVFNK
ncbi:MAG: tetratricopeptide repeat protein, partial [Flavobacteriales bacterium]